MKSKFLYFSSLAKSTSYGFDLDYLFSLTGLVVQCPQIISSNIVIDTCKKSQFRAGPVAHTREPLVRAWTRPRTRPQPQPVSSPKQPERNFACGCFSAMPALRAYCRQDQRFPFRPLVPCWCFSLAVNRCRNWPQGALGWGQRLWSGPLCASMAPGRRLSGPAPNIVIFENRRRPLTLVSQECVGTQTSRALGGAQAGRREGPCRAGGLRVQSSV